MEKTMIQLRQAQLYIAEEIKRICEMYDIRFFLDAGSLLGAVRHKGYIPWDDDMDIGMPKDDYYKFINIAPKELRKEFYLDEYSTNMNCSCVYAKVRLKGTTYIERKGSAYSSHNEIFVDIFPYFYVSDNYNEWIKDARKLAFFGWALSTKFGVKIWAGDGLWKRIKFIPAVVCGKLFTVEKLRKMISFYINKYHNTRNVCILDGWLRSYYSWIIPKEIIESYASAQFENHEFPIPEKYDQFLTIAYGDYMTLPPVEERRTHDIQVLDLGEYKFN